MTIFLNGDNNRLDIIEEQHQWTWRQSNRNSKLKHTQEKTKIFDRAQWPVGPCVEDILGTGVS